MAYDEKLANRIREKFENVPKVKEKQMMGGLTIMVNDKMCVGIFKGELMCRIDPATTDEDLAKHGARAMEMRGKKMNGFVLVDDETIKSKKKFDYWIDLALEYNKFVKPSKKRKATKKK